MLVLGEDARRRVDDQQHNVAALHGGDAPHQAVALETVTVSGLAPDPRGVDQHHRDVVEDELGVDRISRRPRRGAHERSLIAKQSVQQ